MEYDIEKEKREAIEVSLINYSVCKENGNESEMVHCRSCVMDYFNLSFSAFRSSISD